jgi:hypothetical protein
MVIAVFIYCFPIFFQFLEDLSKWQYVIVPAFLPLLFEHTICKPGLIGVSPFPKQCEAFGVRPKSDTNTMPGDTVEWSSLAAINAATNESESFILYNATFLL